MAKKRTLYRSTLAVIVLLLLSKVLGFVRQAAIAGIFGSDAATDLYFVSSDFITTISGAITQALVTALVTAYVLVKTRDGEQAAKKLASRAMLFFELIAVLLTGLVIALARPLARVLAPGYEGAQFPWESAWLDDGEVTPEYMGTDIVTGQLIKVWSGFIEIHITADVAFGVWQYYQSTDDQEFMDRYGYELIIDCAKFWASRLEEGDDGMLHINDVVGPDEYKEHVNDNAFTNYMARWNMNKAAEYIEQFRTERRSLYEELDAKLGLAGLLPLLKEKAGRICLPVPNKDGVLPQDSTYLTLKDIDLTKYRQQAHVGGIYKDFNQEQICKIQVSKQADVMVLFYLLEDLFPHEVKLASWDYYEPRTLHDSSLSLSTHSVLACDIDDTALGYSMFRKACDIDLSNDDPHSSDTGIHAASYGGLWQCVVYGFGGFRMLDGKIRISPALPDEWESLSYTIMWKGQRLRVDAARDSVAITNETGRDAVSVEVWGSEYTFEDKLNVDM